MARLLRFIFSQASVPKPKGCCLSGGGPIFSRWEPYSSHFDWARALKMETCFQSRKTGRSWHKWGLTSFYGNLISYHKGHFRGVRWCSEMCSGIFLMVSLTIGNKKKKIRLWYTVPLNLCWDVSAIKGTHALDIKRNRTSQSKVHDILAHGRALGFRAPLVICQGLVEILEEKGKSHSSEVSQSRHQIPTCWKIYYLTS